MWLDKNEFYTKHFTYNDFNDDQKLIFINKLHNPKYVWFHFSLSENKIDYGIIIIYYNN